MNTVLHGLSKLIPDHTLMWSFNLEPALTPCSHRTFYAHLVFFLEGLFFRWAEHCSSAQINIEFESQGVIDGNNSGTSSPGGSGSSPSSSAPGTPRRGLQASPTGRLQHGYLKVYFQPLDLHEGHEQPIKLHSAFQPPSAMKAFNAIVDLVNMGASGPCNAAAAAAATTAAVAVQPKDVDYHEVYYDNSSALIQSLELLRVMSDFLREIDPQATVAIAPSKSTEEHSTMFLISIPCHFILPRANPSASMIRQALCNNQICPDGSQQLEFRIKTKPEVDYRYHSHVEYGKKIRTKKVRKIAKPRPAGTSKVTPKSAFEHLMDSVLSGVRTVASVAMEGFGTGRGIVPLNYDEQTNTLT